MITARTTRQRRQVRAAAEAFALQPGVRERGEDHVALPPRQGAAFEVVEAEFVLELLILLLDRPALMRQAHQRAQRGGGGQVDQIVLGRGRSSPSARSQSSQTSGASRRSRQSCAGVTRVAQKRARQAGCVPLRHDTTRHARAGCVAAQARASMAGTSGASVGPRCAGARCPRCGAARRGRACRRKTLSVGRDAQGVRQLRAMQGAPQRRALAELRIAERPPSR